MNREVIIWDLNKLIKINEAIEFDNFSSYDYVLKELIRIFDVLEEGGLFIYDGKTINSNQFYFNFIDENLLNPDYLKEKILSKRKKI